MNMEPFEMERMQSTWEHAVRYDLSESGVSPISLRDLAELGLDLDRLETLRLGYSQTNGTVELREAIAALYPGSTADHIEVTNGTSEANFITCLTLLNPGDEVVFESPNYMQVSGLGPALGASVKRFPLRPDCHWEPDWEAFDRAMTPKTKLVYVTNPNNPTGAILSEEAMGLIVDAVEKNDAFLLADEVYHGTEFSGRLTKSFWGMSERVIVTSGLSKAYGLPGVRIGWIVGPPDLVAKAWAQHDYVSIGPSALSDFVACFVLQGENRQRLFDRGSQIIHSNSALFNAWASDSNGVMDPVEFQAGAFAFAKYHGSIPSVELANRLRANREVLLVPGAYLGLESYLRIGLGVKRETLEIGLDHVKSELGS